MNPNLHEETRIWGKSEFMAEGNRGFNGLTPVPIHEQITKRIPSSERRGGREQRTIFFCNFESRGAWGSHQHAEEIKDPPFGAEMKHNNWKKPELLSHHTDLNPSKSHCGCCEVKTEKKYLTEPSPSPFYLSLEEQDVEFLARAAKRGDKGGMKLSVGSDVLPLHRPFKVDLT